MEPTSLTTLIFEAFADVPYPGDDNIVLDNRPSSLEAHEIRGLLLGQLPSEMTFDVLQKCGASALSFMTDSAYRFFLPCFMAFSILDYRTADVVPEQLIYVLTLPVVGAQRIFIPPTLPKEYLPEGWDPVDGEDEVRYFLARHEPLPASCKRAVRLFLEHIDEQYGDEYLDQEPRVALTRYWGQF